MYKFGQSFVSFFGIAVLLAHCGRPEAKTMSNEIVGGTTVRTTEPIFSQIADLSIESGNQWFSCTGTLIAQDVILTAAHCMQGLENPLVIATIAKINKRSRAVKIHPLFNPSALNETIVLRPSFDVALVKLSLPFPESFVAMNLPQAQINSGTALRIAGFGEDEKKDSGVLKSASVNLLEYRQSTKDLVSRAGNVTTGFGDSGGPAMVCENKNCVVVGVISRTINLRREDIYTSVFEVLNWIQITIQRWS